MASLHAMSPPRKAKDGVIEETVPVSDDADEPVDANTEKKLGTSRDRRDMWRMGKIQELKVLLICV